MIPCFVVSVLFVFSCLVPVVFLVMFVNHVAVSSKLSSVLPDNSRFRRRSSSCGRRSRRRRRRRRRRRMMRSNVVVVRPGSSRSFSGSGRRN